MANSRPIVALNVGSQRVSMGVFSKTSKDALILDRYATRLVVLDPSAEGLRLTKIGEAIADLVQELNVKGSVAVFIDNRLIHRGVSAVVIYRFHRKLRTDSR